MRICVAGEGAFGNKHLDALERIDGVDVTALVGGIEEDTVKVANTRGICRWTLDLGEALAFDQVDAVILATPTPMHGVQAIACLEAGKHVLVEIPMADNLADAEKLVATQEKTGLVAMVDHIRRFNPSHQWVHNKIVAGEIKIQQMHVQTYFFRRINMNALGKPRNWTDHLLWHHACHTVDLFQYQTGEEASECFALQGPMDPDLGIAMDMSIGMKTPSGAICTLSLSFNNDGPLGTCFRYICDNGTYIARYDDLFDGKEAQIDVSQIDVSTDGIELADREFIAAINEGRESKSSVAHGLSAMRTLDRLERSLV